MFKKNPPNSKNGMITGGPIDNAIEILLLAHDIRYPEKFIKLLSQRRNFSHKTIHSMQEGLIFSSRSTDLINNLLKEPACLHGLCDEKKNDLLLPSSQT